MRPSSPNSALCISFWCGLVGVALVIALDRLQLRLAPAPDSVRLFNVILGLVLVLSAVGGLYHILGCQARQLRAETLARLESEKPSRRHLAASQKFFDRFASGYLRCQLVRANGNPADFIFLEANPVFQKMSGTPDLVGRRAGETDLADALTFFDLRETFARAVDSRATIPVEYHFRKNNRRLALMVYGLDADDFAVTVDDLTVRQPADGKNHENDVRFRTVFDASPVGLVISRESDGRILEVNPAFAHFHGYLPGEMIGRTSLELGIWDDPRERDQLLALLQREDRCHDFKIKSRKKNGEPFDALIWVEKITFDGAPCLLGIKQEAHPDPADLVGGDERLGQILNHTRCIINAGIVTAEPGWRERAQREDWPFTWDYPVLNVDIAQKVMPLEVPAGDTYYQAWKKSRCAPDEVQMHRNSGRAFLDGAPFYRNEFRCRDRHGVEHWMQQLVTVRQLEAGRWNLFGVTMDVSELKHAYAALGESEEQFRICLEFLPVPIGIASDQGNIIYYNQAFTEHYGYVRSDTPTVQDWNALAYPDAALRKKYSERWSLDVQQAIEKGTATPPRLYRVTRKDGCQRHVEITLRTSGKFLISSFNDLTERIESEIQLRKLSRAVEQSPVSIVITDAAGVIEYVNPRFTQVTGYTATEVMGQTPNFLKSDDAPPESFQQLWQTITAGKDWHGEFHNRKKNGELFWERATISPIFDKASQITHFLALKEDISAQRQLELQLRQSQKMEAIGLLAGGVAHDFNNVLTVIQGNASLMTQPGLSPEEYLEYASQISAASGRAANLTRQLLMFSRKQVIQPTSLDLNDTVSQVSRMLQRILGEDINLISHYSSSLPVIRGDAGMIEQIIMNLSVNARDAMPNGGNLTITTSLGYLDEDNRVPAVCLSVTDTGCGISDEHLQHIFEPFFTTKEYGKGTGLGLATVESIVQQHHGKILVSSRVGEGSTFLIRFPVATQAKVEPAKPVVSHFPAGTETILVVEDEAPVRVFVGKLLERCGYRILRAESGIDALAVWLEHRDNIDLLLTDIIMPGGVNGYELAARLQDDNPQLKVIYTSGYTGDMTGKRSLLVEGVNFLQKPYPPQKLAELLRRVLDAQRSVPVLAGE